MSHGPGKRRGYKVIFSVDLDRFERRIEDYLESGWKLQAGVFYSSETGYIQAMYREYEL